MNYFRTFLCTICKILTTDINLFSKSEQLSLGPTNLRMRKPFQVIRSSPSFDLSEDETEQVRQLLKQTKREK